VDGNANEAANQRSVDADVLKIAADRAFQPCRFLITTRNAGCEACWFVSLSKKNGIWSVKSMAFHDTPA